MTGRRPSTPAGPTASIHGAIFRPNTGRPALMAVGAAAMALLLALALVLRGMADGVTFAAFLSYVVAVLLAALAAVAGYWALAVGRLRYEVTDQALTIVWGLTRQVVPLAHMERVVRGRSRGLPHVHGLEIPRWPCHVGRAIVPGLGEVLLYSTHVTPSDLLYIVTAHETYGLSPANQPALIRALQTAAETGSDRVESRQEVIRQGFTAWPAWTDRFALIVAGVGAVFALAAVAVVFARYTGLSERTTFPFPEKDHTADKRVLLGIPVVALTVLALNSLAALALHRPLRPIAYLLLLSGIFIEALLVIAAFAAT